MTISVEMTEKEKKRGAGMFTFFADLPLINFFYHNI